MTRLKYAVITMSILALSNTAFAAGGGGRLHHLNSAGGVTGVAGHVFQTPNGGGFANGHRVVTDGAGNVSGVSGGAATMANGGEYKRTGQFNRSADGSVNRQGGIEASGQQGSVASTGNVTKSADGSVNGIRNTTTTNAQTGVTKDSSTSYTTADGVTHTSSCIDATGASIACP